MTSPNLDPIDLVKLTEVAEAATQGDWGMSGVRGRLEGNAVHTIYAGPKQENIAAVFFNERTGEGFSDAKFIGLCKPLIVLRLIQRLREVEGALEPFAAVASAYDAWLRCGSTTTPDMFNFAYGGVRITLQSYRAARSALSTVVPPVGEEKQGVMVSSDTVRQSSKGSAPEAPTPLEQEAADTEEDRLRADEYWFFDMDGKP